MNLDSFKLFLMVFVFYDILVCAVTNAPYKKQHKVISDEYQFALVKQAFVMASIIINIQDGESEVIIY